MHSQAGGTSGAAVVASYSRCLRGAERGAGGSTGAVGALQLGTTRTPVEPRTRCLPPAAAAAATTTAAAHQREAIKGVLN